MHETSLQNGPLQAMESFLKLDYRRFNRENLLRILSRYGDPARLHVLYLSTYNPRYTRTESQLALFDQIGVRVTTALVGGSGARYTRAAAALLRHKGQCDVIFVAFRGHELLPLLRPLTRKPILFDAMVSVYDTLCCDRRVFGPGSAAGRALRGYDRLLCRMADTVLVDTQAHKLYFESEFGAQNVEYLYVGCNESLFRPMPVERDGRGATVLWYGSALPLQGVEVMLRAAKLLEGRPVRFRMIGPVRRKYAPLLDELRLGNTDFVDFVPYEQLPTEINRAHLCLGGHFADRDKAARVIAGKTFQCLACARPTILGDNPANRELFREAPPVHFVPMNRPQALAAQIGELTQNIHPQTDH